MIDPGLYPRGADGPAPGGGAVPGGGRAAAIRAGRRLQARRKFPCAEQELGSRSHSRGLPEYRRTRWRARGLRGGPLADPVGGATRDPKDEERQEQLWPRSGAWGLQGAYRILQVSRPTPERRASGGRRRGVRDGRRGMRVYDDAGVRGALLEATSTRRAIRSSCRRPTRCWPRGVALRRCRSRACSWGVL